VLTLKVLAPRSPGVRVLGGEAMGIKRGVVAIGVVVVAAAGVAIGGYFESSSTAALAYNLQATLPKMVSAFGSDARVVEISVGSSDVYFQVIDADGRLHIRDYKVVESEIDAGTYGYNRETSNYVRAPTALESHGAVLKLGQIDPGVVDRLYGKVGFPRQGSSATLTGDLWFLESGVSPDHQYVAGYDGSGLRRARSGVQPDPNIPASTSPPAAPPKRPIGSNASTTTVLNFTTTISSGRATPRGVDSARRLLTCIEHARGDVSKIVACQRRFAP
jgi:hypothetical protein